jgi:segregation and condensation protein B
MAAPGPDTEKFKGCKESQVAAAFAELAQAYEETGSGLQLIEVAGGWQLRTRMEAATWIAQLSDKQRSARLSQPAMETLSIIAYRQPISRADIEAVRGVAVDGVLATLLERNLIRVAGRSEQPGRPLIYETTPQFMEDFALRSLEDLPNVEELRKIVLPKAAVNEAGTNENQDSAPTDRPAGSPFVATA